MAIALVQNCSKSRGFGLRCQFLSTHSATTLRHGVMKQSVSKEDASARPESSELPIARISLALIFIVAGTLHFILTPVYLRIMPAYLPSPHLLIQISGICEILGGAGLLLPATQRFAAWGLIALLVVVMPANIQMALDHAKWSSIPEWVLWARLPMQLPLIWWAWLFARR